MQNGWTNLATILNGTLFLVSLWMWMASARFWRPSWHRGWILGTLVTSGALLIVLALVRHCGKALGVM